MADQLSQDRIAELQEIFSLFDNDHDGAINTRMLGPVLRSCGFNPAENDIKNLLEQFDPEGEGMMEFSTYLELLGNVKREGETEVELDEAFRVFDPTGTGLISSSDLRQAMTSLGEKLSDEEADEMIAFADKAEKGEINYKEFIKLLMSEK